MAIIGYSRVSTIGQSLEVQLAKLEFCDRIYQEKASGLDGMRPELRACLDYVREGDTLFITRLDRLARSTLDLCKIAKKLEQKRVDLRVLDQNIDTSDATGRLMFNMLAAINQFETEIRAERQAEGIKKAREKGIHLGKPKALTQSQVKEMLIRREAGETIRALMKHYNLSKSSVYNYLRAAKVEE